MIGLDERFTKPRDETVDALRDCPGDVVVLGAGGKMGPSLTAMLVRAARAAGLPRAVFAVSRWSDGAARDALRSAGATTVNADLLDPLSVAALPPAPNVIFMAGQKFGTSDKPSSTWAMNTIVPMHAAERYASSRIVAFSTGNVYPLSPIAAGGSKETDPVGPVGEYAASCVGRERVFEHYSDAAGTKIAILRLNYAIDVRYGVLLDIGQRVARDEPVPLAMGYVNVIWQGDANRIAIEALPHASSPPFVVNMTGSVIYSVRDLAQRFGRALGKAPRFEGHEGGDALLSNTLRMQSTFAPPSVPIDQMIEHVAEAIRSGGPTLGKPTHFETRDGRF